MEHESVTARRRLATVAAHFSATSNDSVSNASLVPLNCSSSLNSVIRRCDNKLSFARQASSEQGFFMRQVSPDEVLPQNSGISLKNSVTRRGDNRLYFARQASSAQGFFMRQASTDEAPQDTAAVTKCGATKTNGVLSSSEQPLLSRAEYAPPHFSKAAKEDFVIASDSLDQQKQDWKKPYSPDLPKLANLGALWTPRSNVEESQHNYIMTIELPGASINNIRVEVDNINLTVTGKRASIFQVDGTYHKQEILQGPFKVSWPLPNNVNKDNVSAEFMEGLLRIVIPKL